MTDKARLTEQQEEMRVWGFGFMFKHKEDKTLVTVSGYMSLSKQDLEFVTVSDIVSMWYKMWNSRNKLTSTRLNFMLYLPKDLERLLYEDDEWCMSLGQLNLMRAYTR